MASINVALNKPASASSYVQPYIPGRAVDGVSAPANRWLCITHPAWLSVNLQGIFWINKWTVYNLQAAGWQPQCNMLGYSFQVSMDNINWTTVDRVTGNTAASTVRTIAPVPASFVRLYVDLGIQANPNLASVLEFQVFNIDPTSNCLTGLALNNGSAALVPSFVKTTNSYTAAVPYNTASVTVTPTAEDPNARIMVNNAAVPSGQASAPISLNVGSNTVTVVVTPTIGFPNSYTVNVTRASAPILTKVDVTYWGMGLPSTTATITINDNVSYNLNVSKKASTVKITPYTNVADDKIIVNGETLSSGSTSSNIALSGTTTVINLDVTSVQGTVLESYIINIIEV